MPTFVRTAAQISHQFEKKLSGEKLKADRNVHIVTYYTDCNKYSLVTLGMCETTKSKRAVYLLLSPCWFSFVEEIRKDGFEGRSQSQS